jgi:NADH:ubiquinone oxidoreductase subunit 2 (subunit N)
LWWIKWRSERLFSKHFGLPQLVSLHHCSIPIFLLILPLSEGKAGEAKEPSRKYMVLGEGKSILGFAGLNYHYDSTGEGLKIKRQAITERQRKPSREDLCK